MHLYYIKAPGTMKLHGQVSRYKWTNNISPLLSLIEASRLNAFIGGEIIIIDFGRFTSEDLEKMIEYYNEIKSLLDRLGPDENTPESEQEVAAWHGVIATDNSEKTRQIDILNSTTTPPSDAANMLKWNEDKHLFDELNVPTYKKVVISPKVEESVIIERTEEEAKKVEADVLQMVTQPRPSFYAQTVIQEPDLPDHEQSITPVITTPTTVDNINNISDLRDVSLDSLIVDQIAATREIVFPSYNAMKADLSTADKEIEGFDQRSFLGGSTKTPSVRRTWLYLQLIKEPELVQ